jgi:hypothetical protein
MHELFIIGDPHRVQITVQAAAAYNRADMFFRIDMASKCCGEDAKAGTVEQLDAPGSPPARRRS